MQAQFSMRSWDRRSIKLSSCNNLEVSMRIKEWSFISFSIVALAACGARDAPRADSTGLGGGTSASGSTGSDGGTSASGSTGMCGGAHDSPCGHIDIQQLPPPPNSDPQSWPGFLLADFVVHDEATLADCVC
jgi:hypothetical protein